LKTKMKLEYLVAHLHYKFKFRKIKSVSVKLARPSESLTRPFQVIIKIMKVLTSLSLLFFRTLSLREVQRKSLNLTKERIKVI
jgi:hypothetical protein